MSSPDARLMDAWREWIDRAVTRFGASGFGPSAAAFTFVRVRELAIAPDAMHVRAVESPAGDRGLVIVAEAAWETGVIQRPVAKISWLAADTFELAIELLRSAREAARQRNVVLLSATPGHSPSYVHAALADAGYHVASQALTIRADLDAIAPALARIPLRGVFRTATAADADAVAAIARDGFIDARFTGDPHFPRAWGQELFAAWARNLVLGAADAVTVAEHSGRIIGFVSMTLDEARRSRVPPLLAIDRSYNGWGIGAMLARRMLEWYREQGVKVFIGGTEKSNTPINALYARLGISFIDANLVYHCSPVRGEG